MREHTGSVVEEDFVLRFVLVTSKFQDMHDESHNESESYRGIANGLSSWTRKICACSFKIQEQVIKGLLNFN